jgi:hypothetical protein
VSRAATGWGTAATVKAALQVKWDRGALLRDLHTDPEQWSAFPLRVRLPGPDREELLARFADASAWARELAAAAARDGWQLQTRPVRVGGTTQVLPFAAIVSTPQAGLALLGRAAMADATRFAAALQQAAALDPEAGKLALSRPHDVLAAGDDWPLLLELAAWIRAHPRPDIYVRQIPVAGVHTKVLERHTPLLSRLLLALLPAEAVEPAGRSFAAKFGFAEDARRVRVRSAASVLGVPGGGHADVEWDVAALAALDAAGHGVRELLVTENKTSFRTVPAADGRLIVWGAGYGVDELLSAVPWRHAVAVRYWGDIDTHGFAILSALRAVAPHTTSVLMDTDTLLAHKAFWGREHAPRTDALPHLTADEAEVYEALRAHAHGKAVRLEQEFVRFDLVEAALTRPGRVPTLPA